MKKILAAILVVLFTATSVPVYAAPFGEKGPSSTAVENASSDSVIDRVGDWIATRGKSQSEKDQILLQRRTERAAKRVQKAAENAQKEMAKEAKNMQKNLNDMLKK